MDSASSFGHAIDVTPCLGYAIDVAPKFNDFPYAQ